MMFRRKKKQKKPITVKPYFRDKRNELMRELEVKHKALIGMLDRWNGGGENGNDITKEQMREFPMLEWEDLTEKVRLRRRKDLFNDILVFDTEMKEGGEFGLHKHSDCIERFDVVEGKVLDLKDNTTYKKGETRTYEKGEKHTPIALRFTRLLVYFK